MDARATPGGPAFAFIICVSVHHQLDTHICSAAPTGNVCAHCPVGLSAFFRNVGWGRRWDGCAAGSGEHLPASVRFPWEEGDTGHVGEDGYDEDLRAAGPACETWGRRPARTLQSTVPCAVLYCARLLPKHSDGEQTINRTVTLTLLVLSLVG